QELIGCWNQGEKIGIQDCKLLLVDAVEARGLHRQVLADALVNHPVAAANHRLRLLPARRPRKSETWTKVGITVDVRLVLVTQAETQGEVRPHFPVVLEETAEVPLLHLRFRIGGRQTKLARAAAEQSNVNRV